MKDYSSQWSNADQWDTRCLVNSAYAKGWREAREEVLRKLEILRVFTSHDPDARSFVAYLQEHLTNLGEEIMIKECPGPIGNHSLLKDTKAIEFGGSVKPTVVSEQPTK